MKKIRDERILKAYDEMRSKIYFPVLLLIVLGGVVKYMVGERQISFFYLEPIAIVGSLGYILFRHFRLGLPFFGGQDEYIRQENQKSRARAYMICFYTYIYGNLYFLIDFHLVVVWVNILVCFLPALWLSIIMMKRGVFVPETVLGRKEKESEDLFKRLKVASIVAGFLFGLFFSVIMSVRCGTRWPFDGVMVPFFLVGMGLLTGGLFGFLWYWGMKMSMVWAQKRSNDRSKEEK